MPLIFHQLGCKWLWFGTCCIWILHPSVYSLRRRNFSKFPPFAWELILFGSVIPCSIRFSMEHWIVSSLSFLNTELYLICLVCNFALIGFKSTGDCNSFDYWDSPEDACIWCWEQGYFNSQSHRGNPNFISSRSVCPFLLKILLNASSLISIRRSF